MLSVPRSSPSKGLCCVLEIGALAYELSVAHSCKLHLGEAPWLHYPQSFPFSVGYFKLSHVQAWRTKLPGWNPGPNEAGGRATIELHVWKLCLCDQQKTGLNSHSCIYFGFVQCRNNGIIPVLNKMLAVLHVGIQEAENHFASKHHDTHFCKYTSQGTQFSFRRSSWTSSLMNCILQLNFIT